MGEVVKLDELRPHATIIIKGVPHVILIRDIEMIVTGRKSIAEFEDPELTARLLGAMALDFVSIVSEE